MCYGPPIKSGVPKTLDPFPSESIASKVVNISGSQMLRSAEGTKFSFRIPGTRILISGRSSFSAEEAAENTYKLWETFQEICQE